MVSRRSMISKRTKGSRKTPGRKSESPKKVAKLIVPTQDDKSSDSDDKTQSAYWNLKDSPQFEILPENVKKAIL